MEGAKSIIDQKEYVSRRQNMSEKLLDKQQIERDQKAALENEMFRKAMNDKQKEEMT